MSDSSRSLPSVDKRALRILFSTYWTSAGWRREDERSISPDDLAYAKQAGMMFDAAYQSHDAIVARAILARGSCDQQAVADAFVVSLASRRLELRSVLGSYAVLKHFPQHQHGDNREACAICYTYNRPQATEDLNVLNFERHKWGGVRHSKPLYAALDLELFACLPRLHPTRADVDILRQLISAIEAAPTGTVSATLEKQLGKILPSNRSERDIMVGILGLCGIISTPAHPGFLDQFVPWSARELPARRFVDMAYPACWWKWSDGVNQKAVRHWFGHLLKP